MKVFTPYPLFFNSSIIFSISSHCLSISDRQFIIFNAISLFMALLFLQCYYFVPILIPATLLKRYDG